MTDDLEQFRDKIPTIAKVRGDIQIEALTEMVRERGREVGKAFNPPAAEMDKQKADPMFTQMVEGDIRRSLGEKGAVATQTMADTKYKEALAILADPKVRATAITNELNATKKFLGKNPSAPAVTAPITPPGATNKALGK